ncbi:hypothetical protein [Streptomyces sp. SID12488]|uniref:glycine-rich domain-containing protein n=1 Tax=Streptomyces sp. SID12488 TaxID=2706040 RepID=UPI0013D9A8E2|nr:hypothetical protein [Streptomyces sp. SID12488]NEA64428.1 hypothetical protein [Streptomyces sp. SID12488]
MTDTGTLLTPELRNLLAADARKADPTITADIAARGVGQMAAFLAAGSRTHLPLSPSELVDTFWHVFILRTEAYCEFSQQVAGRMIHHRPELLERSEHGGAKAVRQRTIDAIVAAGFAVDLDFWPELDIADCNQCHAGCHDSPKLT